VLEVVQVALAGESDRSTREDTPRQHVLRVLRDGVRG
jgi:hypothetical protein